MQINEFQIDRSVTWNQGNGTPTALFRVGEHDFFVKFTPKTGFNPRRGVEAVGVDVLFGSINLGGNTNFENTGEIGSSARSVFSFVISAIIQYARNKEPDFITFQADKKLKMDLYDKIVSFLKRKDLLQGYTFVETWTKPNVSYTKYTFWKVVSPSSHARVRESLRSHINLISEAAAGPAAPEIGTLFAYHGEIFAVVGWMRQGDVPVSFEKGKQRLIACDKNDATWVIGKGLNAPSTLAPVNLIQVTGDAHWTPEQYERVHASVSNAIQKGATITVPGSHDNL